MGLFDLFNKKEVIVEFPLSIKTTAEGDIVPMEEIPDGVFAKGMVGPCIGIEPKNKAVVAPCDGKILQLSDTLHAFGIEGVGGVQILVHIGIDTVSMNGDGFTSKVKVGDTVRAGQTIVEVDFDKVRAAGHPSVVITIVSNAKAFEEVNFTEAKAVTFGDELINVNK